MRLKQKAVICGSFHRDPIGLHKLFLELETNGLRVLSPIDINFENPAAKFVKTKAETNYSTKELEGFHLRAIRDADFVWLHAPEGYVGLSASFELGFAYALGKPVISKQIPQDELLSAVVEIRPSVFESLYVRQSTA